MTEYWNAMVPELSVADLEQSLEFYQSIGFSVRFRREDPPFAYIEIGEAQIMLEQIHDDAWVSGELEHPFGRGVNFQIEIKSAATIESLVLEASIPFYEEREESWYEVGPGIEEGQIEFLLQDPDGYLLRFVEPLGERNMNA